MKRTPLSPESQAEAQRLRKRLKAARARAAYWSGRPSAPGRGFNPYADNDRDPDMEYEMAMVDCEALADRIAELTGRRPAVTDYKERFRERFAESFPLLLKADSGATEHKNTDEEMQP